MATINGLTTLAVADVTASDFLPIYDASAGTDKKTALYESGTWTPDLTFGGASTGITYSSRSGFYLRIGPLVFVQAVIILSSKGSATGNATVSNLPATSSGSATAWLTLAWQNMTSSYVNMVGYVATSTTQVSIRGITAAATTNLTNVTDAGFANNTILYIHGAYRAA